MTKTNVDTRGLIRFACRTYRKDMTLFLRRVASDHFRVMRSAVSPLVRKAAAKLHAITERLIDLIHDGKLETVFKNQNMYATALAAARAVIRRAHTERVA